MKILINGDNVHIIEQFIAMGVAVEETMVENNVAYIVTLPENYKMHKGVVPQILRVDDSFEKLNEYAASGDKSLNDFITNGRQIVASGSFIPSDEEADFDYSTDERIRMYNDESINTLNFIASSQVDISEYYNYLERMLKASSNDDIKMTK